MGHEPAPGRRGSASLEQRIKTAYLYSFAGYVEWPPALFATPQSPIRIGIVGSDSIATELSHISSAGTVHGRSTSVTQLAHDDALTGFHILFIAADAAASTKSSPRLRCLFPFWS